MRRILAISSLMAAFSLSCAGADPDRCAFQSQDGSCAVTSSSTGAFECKLDDQALCETVTAYLQNGKGVASTSAALVSTGVGVGNIGNITQLRPPSLVCEPEGTFMCTCCSVGAGCYPCPAKLF